jgi:hypothetical protein
MRRVGERYIWACGNDWPQGERAREYLFVPGQLHPHHIAISSTVLNKNLRHYYKRKWRTCSLTGKWRIEINPGKSYETSLELAFLYLLYCLLCRWRRSDGIDKVHTVFARSGQIGTERHQVSYFHVAIDMTRSLRWILSRRSCVTCCVGWRTIIGIRGSKVSKVGCLKWASQNSVGSNILSFSFPHTLGLLSHWNARCPLKNPDHIQSILHLNPQLLSPLH